MAHRDSAPGAVSGLVERRHHFEHLLEQLSLAERAVVPEAHLAVGLEQDGVGLGPSQAGSSASTSTASEAPVNG